MKLDLVRIGNSRGVRLPKALLELAGIGDTVDVAVERGRLILSATETNPRASWTPPDEPEALDDAFAAWSGPANTFDGEEWTWPAEEIEAWVKDASSATPLPSSTSSRRSGSK